MPGVDVELKVVRPALKNPRSGFLGLISMGTSSLGFLHFLAHGVVLAVGLFNNVNGDVDA